MIKMSGAVTVPYDRPLALDYVHRQLEAAGVPNQLIIDIRNIRTKLNPNPGTCSFIPLHFFLEKQNIARSIGY